jgi:hypothetical protein
VRERIIKSGSAKPDLKENWFLLFSN